MVCLLVIVIGLARRELRRACITQSRCGPGSQRDRRRFERLFHATANTQRESDCLGITDEQRNAHP